MTASATRSFATKVAAPLAFVVLLPAATGAVVELPLPAASVTVSPLTGLLFRSLSVTVIVEVVDPSATTDVGLAPTVELPAVTGPGVNVTVAVRVIVTLAVVSVAV